MSGDELNIDMILALTHGGPPSGDCPADEILLSYRTGRLTEIEAAGLEQHLAACGACRSVLDELARPAPEERARATRKQLASTAPFVRRRRRVVGGAALAAAIVLLWVVVRPPFREDPGSVAGVRFEGPEGTIQRVRSSTFARAGEEQTFDSNSRIVFRVTWDHERSGNGVSVSVWEQVKGGEARLIPEAIVEVVPLGGARVTIPAGEAFGLSPRIVELQLRLTPGPASETFRIRYEGENSHAR